jgi:Glycosyl transferases group 1
MSAVHATRSVLTTVPHDFKALTSERLDAWKGGADVVDRRRLSRVRLVRGLVAAARRYDALLLDGSVGVPELYSDLLAAALIARRRSRPKVVISDSSWKRGSWWADRLACKAGLRAFDGPHVTYCVLSSDELRLFPATWGVDPARVVFTPFCYTFTEDQLAASTSEEGGVFTGGDSLRDYGPLIEAARGLPTEVTVASRGLTQGPGARLPANVHTGPVSHERFVELMRTASVIVVPMQPELERSAGQQTYLNAMAMGKAVVATDSPGVRDYIEDGRTGLVVPAGDAAALRRALGWCLDPANTEDLSALRCRAAEAARRSFSPDAYFARLRAVVDNVLEGRAPGESVVDASEHI